MILKRRRVRIWMKTRKKRDKNDERKKWTFGRETIVVINI